MSLGKAELEKRMGLEAITRDHIRDVRDRYG